MPRRVSDNATNTTNNNTRENNKEILKEAAAIQSNTKAALSRIQHQATATQEVGAGTLEQLYEQRKQLEQIQIQGDRVHDALETSHQLQNKFSRWSWHFGTRRVAKQRADQVVAVQAQRRERTKSRAASSSYTDTSKISQQDEIEVVITPHGKAAKKKCSRHSNNRSLSSSFSSTVVDEVNSSTTNHTMMNDSYEDGDDDDNDDEEEHDDLRSEFKQLAQGDDEINQGLHAVEVQLNELMTLAQTMGHEVQSQTKVVDEFTTQMEGMHHQAHMVNHRAGMFLVGRAAARTNYLVDA